MVKINNFIQRIPNAMRYNNINHSHSRKVKSHLNPNFTAKAVLTPNQNQFRVDRSHINRSLFKSTARPIKSRSVKVNSEKMKLNF